MKLQQSDALHVMRLALDRFQEESRRVFYIQGQHERSAPPILSAMHPWPDYLHKTTVELAGMRVHGLDYCNPGEVESELKNIPEDIDIFMTHQVWKDFLGDKHGDAWIDWTFGNPLIISGDYHRAMVVTHGARTLISPGSLCMQDIGEIPVKSVYILFDDLSTECIQLRTRNYFENILNTTEELDEFVSTWDRNPARIPQSAVPSNIAVNLLRVRYRSDLPQARQRVEATVGTSAHLFVDPLKAIVTEQMNVEQSRRVEAVMQGGLEGCIAEFYSDNVRVRDYAIRLARASNIQTELLSIFGELTQCQ